MGSAHKPRLTAITGGVGFTLLLVTEIQGTELATQTPSKHPGHKPEPTLSLLHAKGWVVVTRV